MADETITISVEKFNKMKKEIYNLREERLLDLKKNLRYNMIFLIGFSLLLGLFICSFF